MNLCHLRPVLVVGTALLAAPFLATARAQEANSNSRKADATQKSSAGKDSVTENRRQALQLLAEAETALENSQASRAASLAREAQRLYPESRAIAGFLATLDTEVPPPKLTGTTHNRAKAHLAAALTRAQVLMQQRRYTESIDLLNGIVEASQKFPSGADVSLYRDLAQKELIEYRIAVQTGKIRPNTEAPPSKPADSVAAAEAPAAAPVPEFPAAPSNAFRLARLSKEQTPAWYTRMRTALKKVVSVDYHAMPLGQVLDELHRSTGVPIIVDTPVQAAKTPLTALVDLRVNTVPAESVLNFVVQLTGCEYVILEKGVVVTTTDKAGDYIRSLPDSVTGHWARARHLFPDLYLEAMVSRPLPEAKPGEPGSTDEHGTPVPSYLRSGRDLVADIEQLIR